MKFFFNNEKAWRGLAHTTYSNGKMSIFDGQGTRMDIMGRMDAMDLPFDGRMDRRKKMSPAVNVHSVHNKRVHLCPCCPFRPFLSLS
jgi:hypothetical protein